MNLIKGIGRKAPLFLMFFFTFLGTSAEKAQGQLFVCNRQLEPAHLAMGQYVQGLEWVSQGWWDLLPGECAKSIEEPLKEQYYYIRVERQNLDPVPIKGRRFLFCVMPEGMKRLADKSCTGERLPFEEIDTGGLSTEYYHLLTQPKIKTLKQARYGAIQRSLTVLGYDPGPVDGLLGRKTIEAVKIYAKDRGVSSDFEKMAFLKGLFEEEALFAAQKQKPSLKEVLPQEKIQKETLKTPSRTQKENAPRRQKKQEESL